MKEKYIDRGFFRSRVFRRIFSSYLIIICISTLVYLFMMVYETKEVSYEKKEQHYNSEIDKLSNSIDSVLMDAMIISSNINASDIINDYAMQTKGIIPDNVSDAEVVSEVKNYTVSRYNINIYDTLFFISDNKKAFSTIQSYDLFKQYKGGVQTKLLEQNISLNKLLNMRCIDVLFQKNFAIYTQKYNSVYANGLICVLFDKSSIDSIIQDLFKNEDNIRIYMGDDVIYEAGTIKNPVTYSTFSALNNKYEYKIEVDKSNFGIMLNNRTLFIFVTVQVLGIILIIAAAIISGKFYKPVGVVEKLIGLNDDKAGTDDAGNNKKNGEFDIISEKIRNLIFENADYKEKMLSIRQYAQKGLLHGVLSNGISSDSSDIMRNNDYGIISKKYYFIADVNIAYVGKGTPEAAYFSYIRSIIEKVSDELSDEETDILLCDKDRFDIYMIINSDNNEGIEDIFYELYRKVSEYMDNPSYAITIGVDKCRTDIKEISEACHNCDEALNNIITAGRNAVYYYEPENDKSVDMYYFPTDAVSRLSTYIKDNDNEKIKDFLEDIMNINIKKYSDNIRVMNILVDELHITTVKVIKNVFGEHSSGFKLEKLKFTATIEEIFNYYIEIYNVACNEYSMVKKEVVELSGTDREIINEINNNLTNEELSLAYLTDKFNVNNKYISTVCKKMLGKTYIQYVQEKRVELAIGYINKGGYTLDEIAELCGYTSTLTFRRNFKSVTGVNPSEYKNI